MPGSMYSLVFAAWFLGGFVNGISGMGAAMVALPILLGIMDMGNAVPAACLVTNVVALYVAWFYRKHCRATLLLPLLAGCIPGIAAGVWVLRVVPGTLLQALLGMMLVGYVIWQAVFRLGKVFQFSFCAGALAGFWSGFANGSISFSGPPVAIYSRLAGWDKDTTRGTLSAFFLVVSMVTSLMQFLGGFFSPEVLKATAYGIPGVLAGLVCSIPVARRISEQHFHKVLMTLIALAGGICLYRSLPSLW